MSDPGNLAGLLRFLDRVRLVLAASAAAAALARLMTVAAVALVLNLLVVEPAASPWVAFGVAAASTFGVYLALARWVRALARPSRRAAALAVQAGAPQLLDDVESSLQLSPLLAAPDPGISTQLIGALVASTDERLAGRTAGSFVSWAGARRSAALLAAALVPLAALAAGGVPGRAVQALVDPRVYWPLGRLRFEVEPGSTRIGRGSDLVVRARAVGARPGQVHVEYRGASGEGFAVMERGRDASWSWRFAAVGGDFSYRASAAGGSSEWFDVRVAERPAAGNFEMRYTYPAYSGLAARTVAGGGQIEALKGTTVEVGFSTNVDVAKATLTLGSTRVAVRPAGRLRHSATLYLNGETTYRLALEDAQGLAGRESEYPVRYLPDAAPVVEVLAPSGSLESDPRAAVTVRYRAADDFGLTALALVSRVAGAERRWPLPLNDGGRSAGGEYLWDLGAVAAAPGDVVSAWVEAADNDTISGPKVGVSAAFEVRIADPRQRREQTHEAMEKLSEDLVQLLAEQLDLQERYQELEQRAAKWESFPWEMEQEAAALQQSARDTASRAQQRASRLRQSLEADAGAREETIYQAELIERGLQELREGLQESMERLQAGLSPEASSAEDVRQTAGALTETSRRAAREAEELTLMAEAMKRERGLDDVDRGAAEMADAEQRLLDALERLDPRDRAAAEAVLAELAKVEQALRDLSEALTARNEDLPEEFLNNDAIKTIDLNEIMGALEQVRELLRRGDVAGAREAALELAKQLADLRSRLRQGGEELDEQALKALEQLRRSAVPKLQALADDQRSLLGSTEELETPVGQRLEQALRALAEARDASTPPAEADLLTPEERGRVDALARAQDGLRRRAEALAPEFSALRGALPFLPSEIGAALEEAVGQMAQARGALERRSPAGALPSERAALAALERARDRAEQALDQIAQMQQMRMGQPASAGSSSRGGERAGGSSDQPRRDRRGGGRRGMDVRNFVIPGRQEHRVPKIFREELMKALRDGYPARYEERIKDYYQRIAE